MRKEAVLSVTHLCCEVSGTKILNDVSLQVLEGEFVGIIGPNGSGKSTLLKNIYKMIRPSGGDIRLFGESLLRMPNRKMARKMAVVAQENQSNFDFAVHEVIEMGRYPKKKLTETITGEDALIVRESLAKVELSGLLERSFLSLSGGEKQRVLIARAFAQDTELIVLDEPTNHLDVGSQVKTLNLLKDSGKTVLMALHDLSLAARYCDRIYVLKKGEAIADGAPEDVITGPLVEHLYGVSAEVFRHAGNLYIGYL